MATTRKGDFEVLDFTPLVQLVPRTPKLITDLGLFSDASFGVSTVAQVERVTEGTDDMVAKPRGADRNFAGRENAIVRNFNVPFFPLDTKFTAKDIQDLRAYGTSDTPQTIEDRVMRTMARIERSHVTLKEKAFYAAIKGDSYSPSWTQGQYDYATEFGVTGSVTTSNVNFTTLTVDPRATVEANARAHIIDQAQDNADSYQVIALCGRQWFSALVAHPLVVDSYSQYPSDQEPLRKRLGGNLINRSFETDGVTYIEDISGQIATGDAYIMPLGISDMFQLHYAPADTIADANTEAEAMYVFMVSDGHRTETIETETSMIAVNTRSELVVKSTGTF
tara:strand:+ start:49 stop:1056 length:1008 start_codon:yes stop_codon:yes gene_type:complete